MNLYNLQIGLKYGCPVEDVITGLSIQCRRWRSVYCNPTRQVFLGIAPTALSQTLVQVSSPWLIPFAYVIFAKYTWSCVELGWWNDQRIWLYKRTSSYLFAFIDTILNSLGYSDSAFVITAKVSDEDVSHNYEKEVMEFGALSPMFTILATLALLNLFCFLGVVKKAIMGEGMTKVYETMPLQILLCGVLILINLPLYQALYLRKDKGKMPSSIAFKSRDI
ncbi:unnamed protein product [Prunus armeniaca]|uniref:Uncharacterized protein n=1 Tax=Prunus armeniaca TaxID=36596 RepID=A0A6J5XH95_PRUAR|nr:unnamed protein product [Prunus armeniaca]